MKGKIVFQRIRERRIEVDFTQQYLSELSGITLSLIKAVETGRSETSYKNVVKIANALKIDIDEIFIEGFRNTKVIAVANNKGGCGKTSVVSSLSYAIAEMDKDTKVLVIDSDMQMNLTRSYGLDRDLEKNLNTALVNEQNLIDFIIPTEYENIDIIVSDLGLSTIDMLLFTKKLRESVFKRILQPIINKGLYDYIIIDTNPTLGLLNFNILNACDYVLIPVELTSFGIQGLEILTEYFDEVRTINDKLQILGVLRTKVDKRENITKEAEEILVDVFGDIVFESYISVDTNVKKAQWDSLPLSIYSKNSRAAKQYKSLAKEVVKLAK
ncbi:AAA family ATPase [Marinisporobacter balticus]|uniref:Chromosome partitioning protein n=1 Tax=Marinisporobacter balticus TaxID=2018667 RepID=A0A4V2SA74_9FIRM|nr:AAA family ATPase [Marinisporobacter balticus]TCO70670.1 chromosome partitioning protein [Marinisporobacter balticus]